MTTYEKKTVAAFKEQLESGGYADLTGARRAIGRMTTWSAADIAKARELADKYFGAEGGAKPVKKAAKSAAKKAATAAAKPAAKAAKKAAKAAKKKAVKKAAKAAVKTESVKKILPTETPKPAKQVRTPAKPKTTGTVKKPAVQASSSETPEMTRIHAVHYRIGTVEQALKAMDLAKKMGAGDDELTLGAKRAQAALTRAIEDLERISGLEMTEAERRGAELFEKAAKAATASGTIAAVTATTEKQLRDYEQMQQGQAPAQQEQPTPQYYPPQPQ